MTLNIILVTRDILKSSNYPLGNLLREQIMLEIELIRFAVVPMEEDDSFCC
jgi:hypothetical protein